MTNYLAIPTRLCTRCITILALSLVLCVPVKAQGVGDIYFLYDISGSMRFPVKAPTGTCADMLGPMDANTRFQKMIDTMTPVFTTLGDIYALSSTVLQDSDASIGMLSFPSISTGSPFQEDLDRKLKASDGGSPFSGASGLPNLLEGLRTSVDCSIFGTPLGDALNGVLSYLISADHTTPDNQIVILVSDGEHNRGPDPTDPTLVGGEPLVWTGAGSHSENTSYRKVYAIGIGDDDNYLMYLSTLATNTGGQFFGWFPPDEVPEEYDPPPDTKFLDGGALWIDHLAVPIFKNLLKYEPITDPVGVLNPNSENQHPFPVSPADSSLIVSIKWDLDPASQPDLVMDIIRPDNSIITEATLNNTPGAGVVHQDNYIYFLIPDTLITSFGDWNIRVNSLNRSIPLSYHYSVFSNTSLALSSNINVMSFSTEDILNGPIRVIDPSNSVTIDSIFAHVLPPNTWLGNWLADPENGLTQEELSEVREGNWIEDNTLIDRKRALLLETKGLEYERGFISQRRSVRLFDDGNHLDGFINDGIYNNEFLIPDTPGVYPLIYSVYGKTSSGDRFQRELFYHIYVSLKPDPDNSEIELQEVSREGNQVTANLTMIFRDQHGDGGNIALPENEDRITINYAHADSASSIIDNLDGTYSQLITYDRRLGIPELQVGYDDVIIEGDQIDIIEEEFDPDLHLMIGAQAIQFKDAIGLGDVRGLFASLRTPFSGNLAFESSIGFSQISDNSLDGTLIDPGAAIIWNIGQSRDFAPYLSFGTKYLKTYDLATNDEGLAFDFGGGIQLRNNRPLSIYVEAKDVVTSGFFNSEIEHNLQLRMSITYRLGGFNKIAIKR